MVHGRPLKYRRTSRDSPVPSLPDEHGRRYPGETPPLLAGMLMADDAEWGLLNPLEAERVPGRLVQNV